MANELQGKKVAILVEQGFEEVELTEPKKALEQAGAVTHIISPQSGSIKSWDHTDWGDEYTVDVSLEDARPEDYDALLLPGGVINADNLRRNTQAQQFAQAIFNSGKPAAVICHAPWLLIDAGLASGRKMTSYHTLQADLKNAGVEWVDEEVVVDNGLVTSRNPDDLPAFNRKMIEEISEGVHA